MADIITLNEYFMSKSKKRPHPKSRRNLKEIFKNRVNIFLVLLFLSNVLNAQTITTRKFNGANVFVPTFENLAAMVNMSQAEWDKTMALLQCERLHGGGYIARSPGSEISKKTGQGFSRDYDLNSNGFQISYSLSLYLSDNESLFSILIQDCVAFVQSMSSFYLRPYNGGKEYGVAYNGKKYRVWISQTDGMPFYVLIHAYPSN